MTRIRQIYADQIFICDTCPTTGGSATCPTTGGSVIYLEGNTDDPDTLRYRAGTDRTACPAFLRGIFLSATPVRLLRDPRSVFSGNTDDADQVDLHRFFNPRLSATSVSPVRPPADPRSVFIGNTNCFLSAIIRNIRVTCPTTGGSATPVRLLADPQLVRLLADPRHLSDHRRIRVLFYCEHKLFLIRDHPSHLRHLSDQRRIRVPLIRLTKMIPTC